ncbi:MAG: sodium:solute symporter family transporter, partial [Sphingobacterium sp.]
FNEGFFILGGTDGQQVSNRVMFMKWDAVSSKIELDSSFAKLPIGLSSLSAAVIGDNLYVAGGQNINGEPQVFFFTLKIQRNAAAKEPKWERLPTWPGVGRFGAVLSAQSNGEYDCLNLFGGKGAGGYLNDSYAYDPKRGNWRTIQEMPRPSLFSPYVVMGQTHIVLFSGSDGHDTDRAITLKDNYHMVKDVMAYHTITNTWIKLGEIPTGVAGAHALRWKDQLLLVGGELRPGIRSPEIQLATIQSSKETSKFGLLDYGTLFLYLVILAGISFYFSKKKDAAADYLLGSKSIPYWAVGISIMATQVSAIGFMSIPAKAYAVNWAYFAGVFTWFIAVPIVSRAYIPFIRKLNVASAYHYLEARFNSTARLFAALVFVVFQLARMGLVLYLPALALAAVTPLDT